MRLVIALGGNALLRRGEAPDMATQRANIRAAVDHAIVPIVRRHEVVITHGNGPQIGHLALQAAAYQGLNASPLDVLGAESEGMIGYLIEMALSNALPDRQIATLLTQVDVDRGDPAFLAPSKPIGPVYSAADAARIGAETNWIMMPDGDRWRRAVPSPAPKRVREIETIRLLLRANVVTVCAGGGGIPVVTSESGELAGVEGVIDKDLTAALIAEEVGAGVLLILTDVPAVWTKWPPSEGTPIHTATPEALRAHRFAIGSMGPKVEAACRFVERTGGLACIGAIEDAVAILRGDTGTIVHAASRPRKPQDDGAN